MDIFVKGVLDLIQSNENTSNAILAGGAVRDEILGLTPCDYDIFIPDYAIANIRKVITIVGLEYKVKFNDKTSPRYRNGNGPNGLTKVYNVTIEGKSIDIIGVDLKNDDDFAKEIISRFDYGINMVYTNGSYIDDSSEKFKYDTECNCMTLHNLRTMSELPKAMERYNKFRSRVLEALGYDVRFESSCLYMKDNHKVSSSNTYLKRKKDIFEDIELPVPTPTWTTTTSNTLGGVQGNIGSFNQAAQIQSHPIIVDDTVAQIDDNF